MEDNEDGWSFWKFSYKNPSYNKLKYVEVYARSFKEALDNAPIEITGGYLLYGSC